MSLYEALIKGSLDNVSLNMEVFITPVLNVTLQ